MNKNRIGPVVLFSFKKNKRLKKLNRIFMFRHKIIDYKKNLAKNFLIFPLHFKISEKRFNFYLKKLKPLAKDILKFQS